MIIHRKETGMVISLQLLNKAVSSVVKSRWPDVRPGPHSLPRPFLCSPDNLEIHFIVVVSVKMPPVLEGVRGREDIFPLMRSHLPLHINVLTFTSVPLNPDHHGMTDRSAFPGVQSRGWAPDHGDFIWGMPPSEASWGPWVTAFSSTNREHRGLSHVIFAP